VAKLTNLRIAGWKSIRDATIDFRPLNVLIGANGAGKSNLVSFFKMLNEMVAQRLQVYVGTTGGADALLHFGSKRTPALEVAFHFTTGMGEVDYSLRLVHSADNALVFDREVHELRNKDGGASRRVRIAGYRETQIRDYAATSDKAEKEIYTWLTGCRVYHVHDTSPSSPMRRGECFIDANRYLYSDAANLPAMLYLYRQRYPTVYRRIVAAVKAIAPFFEDFILEPLRLNPQNISLRWLATMPEHYEPGTGPAWYEFGPHQLSDGTLRAIALFTLLLQPEEDLPEFIVLDEPELGLHPVALAVLADLLKQTAQHSQLLVATQSAALLDHFEPEDIITVNLRDGCSTFDRLDVERLKDWLADYTLSALWERNVIGGGPY
jgi:predicted ATPase